MIRIYTCDEKLEIAGSATKSFVDNLNSPNIKDLIKNHGFDEVDMNKWYKGTDVFDFFNAIVRDNRGSTQAFVAMGMKVAEQSDFPPEMRESLTLPMILEGWQAHYEANHRGAALAPVKTVKLGDNHYQLKLDPAYIYPYDVAYGMAYGFCRLLLPEDAEFRVAYVDGHNPHVGTDDNVIIDIIWE